MSCKPTVAPPQVRISSILIWTRRFEDVIRFYEVLLQIMAQQYSPCGHRHGVFFLTASISIEFRPYAGDSKARLYAAMAVHISVEVTNIEVVLDTLKRERFLGVYPEVEICGGDAPCLMATLSDPDGRLVALVQFLA